ncbi:MAG: adenine phosphoribosyltransferase [Patescibacteria group bacterium]|jgi:adenine phosphoribosyltransferase
MNLDEKIRKIPNWPKEGILFYDVTTLFEDPAALRYTIDKMIEPYRGQKIDKIVAIDARGFLLATPMALEMNTGVSLVRKKGKLPHKTVEASYEKEYGPDTIVMHEDTIKPGEKVLIVDDLLATGGTMLASVELVRKLGGEVVGASVLVNLSFLPGLEKLKAEGIRVNYLVEYNNEAVV